MAWQLVLCDRAGTPVGELAQARSRSIRLALNRVPTVSVVVDADHPMITRLLELDLTLLKAYDDTTGSRMLRFCGPGVTYEKVRGAQDSSVALTFAGVGWRLAHRLIGVSATGVTYGTSLAPIDRGQIMSDILAAINQGSPHANAGDTGIRAGTITPSSPVAAGPYRYQHVDKVYAELTGTLDGPDWEIAPTEPTADALGLKLGVLNVSPVIGWLQPAAVFEFGDGRRNVASWRDTGDANGLATAAVHLPPGYPENATSSIVTQFDATQVALRGLHETVISADLETVQLRQALVDEHVRIRKTPRRVITFTPVAEDPEHTPVDRRRVPRMFADYQVGDIVPFRATETFRTRDPVTDLTSVRRVKTVDILTRVWAATITLDDHGVATPTLSLLEESS